MHKSVASYRDGYKAHVAVEPETGLITAAVLTPANTPDGPTGVRLLAGEPSGLEVLADSAYGTGQTRAALTAAGHTQTIKPIPLRPAVPGGFTKDDFAIDLTAGTVTCPVGHSVAITPAGKAVFDWRCRDCPLGPSAAPGPKPAGPSTCTHRRANWPPPVVAPPRQRFRPAIGAGGPWSNARSRGWSQAATVGSATGA